MLKLTINHIDGGLSEQGLVPADLAQLRELQAAGLTGRELVHEWLTDDWGAPPTVLRLHGTLPDGTVVDERISYD